MFDNHLDNKKHGTYRIEHLKHHIVDIAGLQKDDHGADEYHAEDEFLVEKEIFNIFHNKAFIDVPKCKGFFSRMLCAKVRKNMFFLNFYN